MCWCDRERQFHSQRYSHSAHQDKTPNAVPQFELYFDGSSSASGIARLHTKSSRRQWCPGGMPQRSRSRSETAYLAATSVTEESHQHQEEIEKIKVEGKRAHDRALAGDLAIFACRVDALNPLRVVCCKAREHEHADH